MKWLGWTWDDTWIVVGSYMVVGAWLLWQRHRSRRTR